MLKSGIIIIFQKKLTKSCEPSGNRRFNQMKYKFVLVRNGLVLHDIIYAYCIYVVPCNIWSSSLKNDRVMTILDVFGLVQYGLVLHGIIYAK